MIGETLAHYRVTSKLGAGGMGEVFRATDSKLNRDVALKVLPEHFASDADRMARFHREAQVLASLSHPNIAAIFGIEESSGRHALVMELVEGEDLSERMGRGPLPLDEALRIALQIATALEAAHERGIIHRDLKPANVKLARDGHVKVLDFGLAKALEGPQSAVGDVTQSPTLSLAATKAGLILGTAAYMSPEQASGVAADKRCDVWSFGVVLFEMLTGRRLFDGETVSHTLADVLRADIDFNRLPENTPGPIRRLLQRCLERDRKRRLRDIGEARIAIEDVLASASGSGSVIREAAPAVVTAPARAPSRLPWAIAGLAVLLLGASGYAFWRRPVAAASNLRLRVDAKMTSEKLWTQLGASIEVSPDGSMLAYVVGNDDRRQLYIRQLDQLDGTKLVEGTAATGAPYHPFFSPDGKWIGYVTATELRKVPVSGGTPLTLCKVNRSRGASWGADDTIVFNFSPDTGLFRVAAAGGEPKALTTLDKQKKEATHRWPQVLPGGEAVLFTSHTQSTGDFDNATIEVVKVATGERKVVQRGGGYGRYVPSGHLVYANKGTLFAVPFDLKRLEVTGSPAPVAQNVTWNPTEGAAQLSFSNTGLLAYIRGGLLVPQFQIVWVDRQGNVSRLIDDRATYANPRLSPDGKQLALTVLRDGNWDVWVYDLVRSVSTRLTFDDASDTEQIWSPDGRDLVFSSGRKGVDNLYRKRADGSGEEERLTEGTIPLWASSWAPDDSAVVATSNAGSLDVSVIPLRAPRNPQPLLKSTFSESDGAISPNGRWLAYASAESGRSEIYVQPFPSGGGRWQISDAGGGYPRWSRDGKELFYRSDDGIMSASIESGGDSLRTSKPLRLFSGDFQGGSLGLSIAGNSFADYDVSADGRRFVMFSKAGDNSAERAGIVTLVAPWFDELTRTFTAPAR